MWGGGSDCSVELETLAECSDICAPNPCGEGQDCFASLAGGYTCKAPITWCDTFCNSLLDGCAEGMGGSVEDCVAGCNVNEEGPCAGLWATLQKCFALKTETVCDEEFGIVPADGSCADEFAAFAVCDQAPPG